MQQQQTHIPSTPGSTPPPCCCCCCSCAVSVSAAGLSILRTPTEFKTSIDSPGARAGTLSLAKHVILKLSMSRCHRQTYSSGVQKSGTLEQAWQIVVHERSGEACSRLTTYRSTLESLHHRHNLSVTAGMNERVQLGCKRRRKGAMRAFLLVLLLVGFGLLCCGDVPLCRCVSLEG